MGLLFFFYCFSFGLRGFSDTQVACAASEVVSPSNFSVHNITCKSGLVHVRAGKCFPDTKHFLASIVPACLWSGRREKQWIKKKKKNLNGGIDAPVSGNSMEFEPQERADPFFLKTWSCVVGFPFGGGTT